MKKLITAVLFLLCMKSAYPQENQLSDADLQEILDRAIEYCTGFNGVTIDRDKAQVYFQYLASQQGYYAAIGKQALIEENMVDCEKISQYFNEIENEMSKNKTADNSNIMNFLCRQYDEESFQEHPCTPKDDTKCHFWAKTSAELGNSEGQFLYGCDFLYGIGTTVDPLEGLKWIKSAADGGYKAAMMGLGQMYLYGDFVQQNDKQALYWFTEAANHGEGDAYYYVAIANFYGGNDIEQNMEEAKRWCQEGISRFDNTDCYWLLSEILYSTQNDPERLNALEIAAERDCKSAQAEVAKLHAFELIPEADSQWGIQALKALSDEGEPRAMAIYGGMLHCGIIIRQNLTEGTKLIRMAAKQGDRIGKQNAKALNL